MGIACKDFVMLAADMTKAQSILVMKNGMNSIFVDCCLKFMYHPNLFL